MLRAWHTGSPGRFLLPVFIQLETNYTPCLCFPYCTKAGSHLVGSVPRAEKSWGRYLVTTDRSHRAGQDSVGTTQNPFWTIPERIISFYSFHSITQPWNPDTERPAQKKKRFEHSPGKWRGKCSRHGKSSALSGKSGALTYSFRLTERKCYLADAVMSSHTWQMVSIYSSSDSLMVTKGKTTPRYVQSAALCRLFWNFSRCVNCRHHAGLSK